MISQSQSQAFPVRSLENIRVWISSTSFCYLSDSTIIMSHYQLSKHFFKMIFCTEGKNIETQEITN